MKLQISDELRDLIPKLQEGEKELLEESILEEGVRDKLVIWDGVIVDGHNRYEICQKHNIDFEVQEMEFDSMAEAKNWMIDNQLARRNLTDSQRRYFIGKRYEEEKKAVEEFKGNQYTKEESAARHNVAQQRTSEKIAKDNNVSHRTVERNADYSRAIDAIREIEPKLADDILSEKVRATNKEIVELTKAEPEERVEIINEAKSTGSNLKKATTNVRNRKRREELQQRTEEAASNYEDDELVELVHADAVEYLKEMESESVDLIVIDPPYYGVVKDEWDNSWDTMDDYLAWSREWMQESLRVLKDTGSFYIWGGVGERSDSIIRQKLLLDELGFHFKDWITWSKTRGMGNRRGWLYTREECLWYVKDNDKFYWNTDNQYSDEKSSFTEGFSGYSLKSENKRITNVWSDIPEYLGDKGMLHYTPKPVTAIERIISTATDEGDVVLDFFGGSGTTGIASRNLNRKCILVEKDEASIKETKRRLNDGV